MYSKHLGLLEKNEDSAPFLMVPSSIFDVRRFLEEAQKLPDNFISLSLLLKLLSYFNPSDPPTILAVSALASGLFFYSALVWRVSLSSCSSQKVPCFLRAPKIL